MNPAKEILEYSKHYSNVYSNELPGRTGLLSAEEMEFMEKQANSSISDMVAACQAKLNLGLEYFYAVQQQLMSTQQAWAAIIAEKERYDTVGWQAGTADFTRALHTCLYMIPKRSNMGLLGPFHGVKGIGACADGVADFSSNSGSIPVAYDNGSGLPDYEDSLCESAEFENWGGLDALSSVEGDDQRDGDCEEDEQNDASRDEEEEQSIYEPRGTQNLEDFQVFDPWNAFLSDQEPFLGSTVTPAKRPIIEGYEGPESDVEIGGDSRFLVRQNHNVADE
ncbi:hypothetical protein B0H63DRAFT_520396 [Podospora didyma]|uniref:Uncharacterized protein n=1 Tax=Podospora didyma TaxID=330526 RepID=A0AAE0P193_9PEZI|nr:hypothetical protein B0H63DRAFT_520396 [Podospora didyma]